MCCKLFARGVLSISYTCLLYTSEHIVKAVSEAASKPENYKYALTDLLELGDALISYYKRRYGVELFADEFTSVNGSQDGIGHLGLAMCNADDYVLLPLSLIHI